MLKHKYFLLIVFVFSLFVTFLHAQTKYIVSKFGKANFSTVQAALNAVPINNASPIHIIVKKGVYYEKLVLDTRKNFVTLVGEDKDSTILTYNNHAKQVLPNGDTINTWNSASFFIYGDDFTAKNITFQNNAGFDAGQAVAVFANGNRLAFTNCNFKGFQDVLFCSGVGTKQYYENCYIKTVAKQLCHNKLTVNKLDYILYIYRCKRVAIKLVLAV